MKKILRNTISSTLFDLYQIPNLSFYYDSQDITKVTDVGAGVISELIDKLNPSNKCTQTNNTRRGIRQINPVNGKHGIYFDGTDDFYTGNSTISPIGSTCTKIITVMPEGLESAASSYNLITSGATSGNRHQLGLLKFSSTVMRFNDAFIGSTIQFDTDLLNSNAVLTIIKTISPTEHKLYINGVLVKTSSTAFSNADNSWLLGAFNATTPQNFFKGYIHDIAIIPGRVISDGGVSVNQVAGGEVSQIDEHQRLKYRIPSGNYIVMLDAIAQSNSVGRATAKSDNNAAYIGFEYIPSLRLLRDLKDSSGESYSLAINGSLFPPLAAKIYELSGRRVIVCKSSKTGSTIDSSGAPDANTHWGAGGLLRTTAKTYADALVSQYGKVNVIVTNNGEGTANHMASNPSYLSSTFKSSYISAMDDIKSVCKMAVFCMFKTVTARVAGTDTAINPTQFAEIQTREQEIADERTDAFITDTLVPFNTTAGDLESDGIHITKTGNVKAGNGMGILINSVV